jgi:hypothetical protein
MCADPMARNQQDPCLRSRATAQPYGGRRRYWPRLGRYRFRSVASSGELRFHRAKGYGVAYEKVRVNLVFRYPMPELLRYDGRRESAPCTREDFRGKRR